MVRPADPGGEGDVAQRGRGGRQEVAIRPGQRRSASGPCAESGTRWTSSSRGGAPARDVPGASSSTRWALVPPNPNELTPASLGPSGAGQGTRRCRDEQRQLVERDVRVGPVEVEARRDRAVGRAPAPTLISPAIPAAASRWPMLRLDRAQRGTSGRPAGRRRARRRAPSPRSGRRGSVPVPWASTYSTRPGATPAWR